ncbi:MAG TPA: hypothetical protein VGB36_06590 [Gammaproteobacteria bacterium]|jgi:hypothetical protein
MAIRNLRRTRSGGAARYAAVAGIFTSVYTAPVFAYLDPGTGSIILQGLLAGVAIVVAAGSVFWHRIKSTFASLFRRKPTMPAEPGKDSEN